MSKFIYKGIFINKIIILIFNYFIIISSYIGSIVRKNNYYFYYFFLFKNKMFIYPVLNNKFVIKLWGTIFKTLINDIFGVCFYHTKLLLLDGVGYKAFINVNVLKLYIGYSVPFIILIPEIIFITIDNFIKLKFKCIDNVLLGNYCHRLLNIKQYNIYTGKGIKDNNIIYLIKNVKKK